jgi:hypothetical protein
VVDEHKDCIEARKRDLRDGDHEIWGVSLFGGWLLPLIFACASGFGSLRRRERHLTKSEQGRICLCATPFERVVPEDMDS